MLQKCLQSFQKLNIKGEVIVVDNQSTDNSYNKAKEAGAKVISCKARGYGSAIREGFKEAQGEYVLMADGDNS